MPTRMRLVYLAITISVFIMAGIPLLRELTRPRDIWWTPKTMMVPLAKGADRVEIYARDESLGSLLQMERLQVVDQHGNNTLKPGDVVMGFNNWDRLRSERLPLLLVDAAMCGMLAVPDRSTCVSRGEERRLIESGLGFFHAFSRVGLPPQLTGPRDRDADLGLPVAADLG